MILYSKVVWFGGLVVALFLPFPGAFSYTLRRGSSYKAGVFRASRARLVHVPEIGDCQLTLYYLIYTTKKYFQAKNQIKNKKSRFLLIYSTI